MSERPTPAGRRGVLLDALAVACILALLLALLGPALFSRVPAGLGDALGDGRTQFYPWRVFGFERWRDEGLPLWNPYALLGMPFVANLQSAMFYPVNWLCFVLPVHAACNWAVLINLFLSAAFTYSFARRLGLSRPAGFAAGVTYALAANHFFRVYQGHWSFLGAMPWAPAVLWCTEGVLRGGGARAALLGAAALALQLLAGMPQITFYTGLLAAVYFVVRLAAAPAAERPARHAALRRVGLMAAMVAGALLLSAVQMLPALELARESSRMERVTLEWATQYSLPPENLIGLVVPGAFGPVRSEGLAYWGRWNFWEVGCYMGLVGLMLAGLAAPLVPWRRWAPFAAPGALLVLIATARYHPLYGVLFRRAPGFNLFRAPGRAAALLGLCVGMAAGMGLDALFIPRGMRRGRRWAVTAVAATLLATALAASAAGPEPALWRRFRARCYAAAERIPRYDDAALRTPGGDRRTWAAFRRGLARSAGFAALAAVVVHLGALRGARRPWLAAGMALLIAADLGLYARGFVATFDPRDRIWDAATLAALQRDGQPFRISLRREWDRYPCDPMMDGVASLEGIEPNVPDRFHDFFWTMQGVPLSTQRTEYRLRRESRLLDLVNLKYVMTRRRRPGGGVEFRVGRRPGALPRAFLVHRGRIERDRAAALRRLGTLDFRTEVLLEGYDPHPREWPPPQGPPAVPRFERYDCHSVRIRVATETRAFLVLSDLYYPGWRATVDGRPVRILRADYLLRAVEVPEGEHVVEFIYAPASFRVGAAMSLCSWLGAAAVFGLMQWRSRRGRKTDQSKGRREADEARRNGD